MGDKDYFLGIRSDYLKAVRASKGLYLKSSQMLQPFVYGKVLDLGNGGVINYALDRVEKLVCQDIVFNERVVCTDKVCFVYGDFYQYKPLIIPDVVIAQFLFHHLVDDHALISSLRNLKKNMATKSRLIIAEVELTEFARFIQEATLPFVNWCLSMINKPGVRFFSIKSLTALLNKAGFVINSVQKFDIDGIVNPAPVICPGLKIPGQYYPFKIMIVETSPQHKIVF